MFPFVLFICNHLVLCPLINKAWDAGEDGERRQCFTLIFFPPLEGSNVITSYQRM